RPASRAVRSPGEDTAGDPAMAQPLGSLPRAVLCRRSARQDFGQPCEGVKRLYSGSRSEVVWTEAAHAVDLASHTGLRCGGLLRLSWPHVGKDAITIATSKSRGRREAIVPIYGALRTVLARIPRRSTMVLTNARGRTWTLNGFTSAFNRAKH